MSPGARASRRGYLRGPRAAATALLLAALVGLPTAAAGARAPEASPWSPEEQQFLYELNRARWDPAAAGLAGEGVLPAPPLAVNDRLAAAAAFRTGEMAAYDYFAHQSPVTGLWPNAVARQYGYPLPEYWPDDSNNIESIHYGQPTPTRVLESLLSSPSHRTHIMGQGWFATHREVGISGDTGERLWAVMTATDGSDTVYLTGVAYDDVNGNRRMDLGEGLGGVAITAGSYSTTTNASGGWAIPVVADGLLIRVSAAGGRFSGKSAAGIRVSGYNIEIDFLSGRQNPQVYSYQTCAGRSPTILGTGAADTLTGTPGADVIFGGDGADTIDGLGGNDIICGGGGADTLRGGAGKDRLVGGTGADTCLLGEVLRGCESTA